MLISARLCLNWTPLVTAFALLVVTLDAQTLGGGGQNVPQFDSPVVGTDGTVTLRFLAPDAEDIVVSGELDGTSHAMTKGEDGVWSVSIGPLPPDIYTYSFSVDGIKALDQRNPNTRYGYGRFGSSNLVQVPGDGPQFYDVKDVPHGVVRMHPYVSKSMGVARTLWVYTPPSYETGEGFPVLYLLHGGGDIESAWTMIGRANNILDNLIAGGEAEPMVVVMPLGHAIQSFWAGPEKTAENASLGRGGKELGAFAYDLLEDVMPLVEESYKVSTNPKDRAIGGLSMGGGLTMNVAFNRPELFRYVLIMSSGGQNAEEIYPDFFGNTEQINEQFRLLWVSVGKDDSLAISGTKALVNALEENGIEFTYHLTEGRHEWTVWRHHLRDVAPLLFR